MLDKPLIYSMSIVLAVNVIGYVYYQWKYRRGILAGDLCRWRYFLYTLFVSSYAGIFMYRSITRVMIDAVSPGRPGALGILFLHLLLIVPFVWFAQRRMGRELDRNMEGDR